MLSWDGMQVLNPCVFIGVAANPSFPRIPRGGAIRRASNRTGGMEGRTLTTAEWIKGIFAQGMVYTRLFDEKLGVSEKAKSIAAKVSRAFGRALVHSAPGILKESVEITLIS